MKKKVPPFGWDFLFHLLLQNLNLLDDKAAESQFAEGKFIQHPVASIFVSVLFIEVEPATSIGVSARSGAEGAERPGDVRIAPTGAERRPHEVRWTSVLSRPERSVDRRFKSCLYLSYRNETCDLNRSGRPFSTDRSGFNSVRRCFLPGPRQSLRWRSNKFPSF